MDFNPRQSLRQYKYAVGLFSSPKSFSVSCIICVAQEQILPSLALTSPSLYIPPHTGSALSSTGWPLHVPGGFSHPLLSHWNWIAVFFPPPLSAEIGNGQDVKLVLICCSREWTQCETHRIKKHFEFNEWDWPIQWQLCKWVLKV